MGMRKMWTVVLALGLFACDSDSESPDTASGTETTAPDTDSGDTTGNSTDASASGETTADSSDSGATDDPYGMCSEEAQCPVEGSRCPGSSQTCTPPCAEAADCPAVMGFSVECVSETCSIPCSVSTPCPAGMTCLAGITCGYS